MVELHVLHIFNMHIKFRLNRILFIIYYSTNKLIFIHNLIL